MLPLNDISIYNTPAKIKNSVLLHNFVSIKVVGVEVPFTLLRVSLMREACVLCPLSVFINAAGLVPNLLTRLCGCYGGLPA